jgi:ribosomal protein S6--L-glutamate ligase
MRSAVISMGSLSSKWTVKAMKNYFESVDHVSIKSIEVKIGDKKYEVLYNGQPLPEYSCIYAKGSFRYANLLRTITHALSSTTYMPVQARAFTIGHDKLLTHLKLNDAKIPTPTTYMSSSTEAAKKILKRIAFPVIMKFPHGTHGKGVMFADSYESASSMLDALSVLNQPFIIQEFVETGGMDTRAIVVGDKVVAAMRRKAIQGEKRANIHAGGKGEAVELDTHTRKIAVRAAEAVGADICAVDLLEGARGPVVIEANLSPGLQGITKATKIDVADKIAKFLAKNTKQFKAEGKETGATEVMKELGIEKAGGKEIIAHLSQRGDKILLPEVVGKMFSFKEDDEFAIKIEGGTISIQKIRGMEEESGRKK